MHRNNNKGSCAFWAPRFAALGAVLALATALNAQPAKAQNYTFVSASTESTVVWMINLTTGLAVAQIPQQGFLSDVYTADGTIHYILDDKNNKVQVYTVDANGASTLVASIDVVAQPAGLALSLDETHLYVLSIALNELAIIDTLSRKVVEVDPAPPNHFGISESSSGTSFTQVK
ncbi:MAG TPA: hypothetical protein VEK34_09385 [Methylocella sp.]|nr:hypothetical protein [Methylocella sp.]